MGKGRFRKKVAQTPAFESNNTKKLRRIAVLVNEGDFPAALAQIDSELTTEKSLLQRGKLMGQVARTLYKRGRFMEASAAFAQATTITAGHPRAWYPLKMASVQSLLKQASVPEAITEANACYATAEAKLQEFETARSTAASQFAQTGTVVVPLKPFRLSVVASELGNAFLLEGELDTAKAFYEKAISGNPRGGTRARQGLAEIALRMDDPDIAFQRAVEALTLGKFQAKTISTWKLLFAAKRKLGQPGIPAELLASVKACNPSVRARTTLSIVRELRSANDPQWTAVANDWLASQGKKFPATTAELRKLLLADSKHSLTNSKTQIANAQNLLLTEELAPHEWLAAAKEYVRASLFAKNQPDFSILVAQGTLRYGPTFSAQLKHSLALSCMMAKRHDLARPLLKSAIAETSSIRNHIWSKSQWAIGRMEAFLENYSAAVAAFESIASAPSVPQNFRLQARVLWIETLQKTENAAGLEDFATEIPRMLEGVTDYDLLLNFARQLQKLGSKMRASARMVFERGETAAVQAFNTASHPSIAIDALFKLTRRQLYDFGGYKAVITRWEAMPQEKLAWMWSNNRQYWLYFTMISEAYFRNRNIKAATTVVGTVLNDSSTPREALAIVGAPYYEALLRGGEFQKAINGFTWLITEYPTATGTTTAYYWLALAAYKSGDDKEVFRLLTSLGTSNSHTEIKYEQWRYGAKSELLRAKLEIINVSKQAVNYSNDFLRKMRTEIINELLLVKN